MSKKNSISQIVTIIIFDLNCTIYLKCLKNFNKFKRPERHKNKYIEANLTQNE